MLRLDAIVVLALLLAPLPAGAELWLCPQADGSEVYTDQMTDPHACRKYEAGADVSTGPSASTAAVPEAALTKHAFTQQELDQMLAPIALYPDSLLSQILMAATYPLEVVEAARWSRANPNLTGEQAVQAVAQNSWDPSVKSLVAFPQILTMMDERLTWMERLGDAFLSQQAQVMDTVQAMRQKASSAGNLKTTDQVRVETQGQTIIVEPANPQVIYVPYYDPMVVYGPWWWPAYPPVYWAPWPGYFVRPGFVVGFAWGLGIPVGERFFFGTCDWRHRHVTVVNVTNYYYHPVNVSPAQAWEHDPVHRRGVLYRDAAVRQQFRRTSASPETRLDFRGHEPSAFESRRAAGSRPEERGGASGRVAAPDVGRSSQHVPPGRLSAPSGGSPPHGEPRPHAFEGVGQGAAARSFSERGHASAQGAAPQSSSSGGASHGHSGGSGGGGHGGGGGGHGGGSRR